MSVCGHMFLFNQEFLKSREVRHVPVGPLFLNRFFTNPHIFNFVLSLACSSLRCIGIHCYSETKPQHTSLTAHLPRCVGWRWAPWKTDRLSNSLFSVTCVHFQMSLKSYLLLSLVQFFFCSWVLIFFKHYFIVIIVES